MFSLYKNGILRILQNIWLALFRHTLIGMSYYVILLLRSFIMTLNKEIQLNWIQRNLEHRRNSGKPNQRTQRTQRYQQNLTTIRYKKL